MSPLRSACPSRLRCYFLPPAHVQQLPKHYETQSKLLKIKKAHSMPRLLCRAHAGGSQMGALAFDARLAHRPVVKPIQKKTTKSIADSGEKSHARNPVYKLSYVLPLHKHPGGQYSAQRNSVDNANCLNSTRAPPGSIINYTHMANTPI